MKYPFEGLNELSKKLHEFQVEAGFGKSTIDRRMMLIHSEISEAHDAFRNDNYPDIKKFCEHVEKHKYPNHPAKEANMWKDMFELAIKDTFGDELTDALIRLLAFMGEQQIDIEFHAKNKMKYNHLRGYKYGGKKF